MYTASWKVTTYWWDRVIKSIKFPVDANSWTDPNMLVCVSFAQLLGTTWNAAVGFNRLFGYGKIFQSSETHSQIGSEACWQTREPHLHGQMAPFNLSADGLAMWRGSGSRGWVWQHQQGSLLRWKNLIAQVISSPYSAGSFPHLSLELA